MTCRVSITNEDGGNHVLNVSLEDETTPGHNIAKFELHSGETQVVTIWGRRYLTIVEQVSGQ